jgi:translation elongation factor EF-Tu-like GTPase
MHPFLVRIVWFTASACLGAASAFGQAPQAKQPPRPRQFAANDPIPVTFNLQAEQGKIGRATAISANYRPQVRFQSAAAELTCKLDLPPAMSGLEPGAASTAALRCDGAVRIDPKKPDFKAFEGGRQVGLGAVLFE